MKGRLTFFDKYWITSTVHVIASLIKLFHPKWPATSFTPAEFWSARCNYSHCGNHPLLSIYIVKQRGFSLQNIIQYWVWGMPMNSISRWNYAGCCRAAVTFSLQWGSYDWLDLLDLVRRGRCRLCSCTRSHHRIRLPLAKRALKFWIYILLYAYSYTNFLDCAGSLCAIENYLAYVRNNFIIFIYNITSI